MTTLTGKVRKSSYGGVLIVADDNTGVDTTVKTVYTAQGTASALGISTGSVSVTGSLVFNGNTIATIAPGDATYICKTANSTLSNEFALSTLSSGIVKVTTTTGDLTSIASVDLGGTDASGTLAAARFPALTGVVTTSAGSVATSFASAALTAFATYDTNGLITQTATNTYTGRTLTGTAGTITVTNGNGVSGNPTVTIDATYVGQATITTLGTITTGTWTGTTIAVNKGGTGQTSYTNGQLLIGNTTGNTLALGTLTQPAAGVTITNGTGTITFALANDLSAVEGLSSNGMVTRTATDTWTTRTITGTANKVDVTNGDGIAGAPTLTVSSTLDLSANTSVAIPSGAGGTTINAAGKVCVDTTSKTLNFYNGAAETTLDPQIARSITVPTPGSSEKIPWFRVDAAYTVTKISAILIGSSTPSVTYKVMKGSDLSAAGTAVVTAGSTVTSVTSTTNVTSFDSAGVTSGDMVWLTTTASSGTVNYLHVTVYLTRDA